MPRPPTETFAHAVDDGTNGARRTDTRRDIDLCRQLRRAAASVALNMAEGQGNEAGTRRQRYLSALGSARETLSCLEVAEALGYVVVPPPVLAELSQVIGVLVVLVRGRR